MRPGRSRTTRNWGAASSTSSSSASTSALSRLYVEPGTPVTGHSSVTFSSLGPGAYAPTEEATTSAGTLARTAASATCAVPVTLVRRIAARSWLGWICQARWTTAAAPANASVSSRTASAPPTSTACQSTPSYGAPAGARGTRRATPVTASICSSRARRRNSAVPTLPDAPTTTTRIPHPYPGWGLVTRRYRHAKLSIRGGNMIVGRRRRARRTGHVLRRTATAAVTVAVVATLLLLGARGG